MQWFYYAGTLYVSKNSEYATRSITPNGISLPDFRKALTDLGVVDPKFGWGELADRGVAMVSGPPAYVDLVAWAVATLPLPQPQHQIRVFRLIHAQVNDRVISYRDQQITTAGVASILRALITGQGGAGGTTASNFQQLSMIAAPLRAAQPVAEVSANPASSESAAPASAPGQAGAPAAGLQRQTPPLRPVIQADSRLNAVIIKDIPQHMPIYEDLLKLLDVPTRLIEIEAVIVDVNSNNLAELGIDWGARAGNVAGGFGRPAAPPDNVTGTIIFGRDVSPTTVIPNAGNFLMSRVRLLEGKGSARVVSRPSVLTVDNLGALIDLSETFYVQSVGERVASVVPISVGTTLKVTPHIIDGPGGSSVQLIVDIEDGAIQDVNAQTLPRVRRSTIGTQAVMNERESLLIGGFNAESDIRQVDQVPALGNVPLLGLFFKKKSTRVEKRERLFLITPKILNPVAGVPLNTQ
ncbi:MAG: type III secretion system outer membrane ring subunit SctC [Burkholderiaceae bacterium]|nr:type III secretion system outer membrane ring subunit SctC [Burkholderiaceae bacterium]